MGKERLLPYANNKRRGGNVRKPKIVRKEIRKESSSYYFQETYISRLPEKARQLDEQGTNLWEWLGEHCNPKLVKQALMVLWGYIPK